MRISVPYLPAASSRSAMTVDERLVDLLESDTDVFLPSAALPITADTRGEAALAITGGYRGRFALPMGLGSGGEREGLYFALNYSYLRGWCPCAGCQGHSFMKIRYLPPASPVGTTLRDAERAALERAHHALARASFLREDHDRVPRQLPLVEDAQQAREIAQRRERLDREAKSRRTSRGVAVATISMSLRVESSVLRLPVIVMTGATSLTPSVSVTLSTSCSVNVLVLYMCWLSGEVKSVPELNEGEPGRTFRVVPSEMWSVENSHLANPLSHAR